MLKNDGRDDSDLRLRVRNETGSLKADLINQVKGDTLAYFYITSMLMKNGLNFRRLDRVTNALLATALIDCLTFKQKVNARLKGCDVLATDADKAGDCFYHHRNQGGAAEAEVFSTEDGWADGLAQELAAIADSFGPTNEVVRRGWLTRS